jgi:hypothetical protein
MQKLYTYDGEEGVSMVQTHTVFHLHISFSLPSNSLRYTTNNAIFMLGNWGLEKLNNLLKVFTL